ncbi:hypothetical protein GGQ84_003069 [Desulfitispora alkaliphila]|uniref:hypothetical protein n=1 Tax=Desulfitispora alkaliphila TaxID=622674 RepID=UPI003D19C1A3
MDKKQARWRQIEKREAELTENKREEFLEQVGARAQGISGEKEKFIQGLYTGSVKRPYPHKDREN